MVLSNPGTDWSVLCLAQLAYIHSVSHWWLLQTSQSGQSPDPSLMLTSGYHSILALMSTSNGWGLSPAWPTPKLSLHTCKEILKPCTSWSVSSSSPLSHTKELQLARATPELLLKPVFSPRSCTYWIMLQHVWHGPPIVSAPTGGGSA